MIRDYLGENLVEKHFSTHILFSPPHSIPVSGYSRRSRSLFFWKKISQGSSKFRADMNLSLKGLPCLLTLNKQGESHHQNRIDDSKKEAPTFMEASQNNEPYPCLAARR